MSTDTPSRDRDILRTLAERIDRTDPGALNNLGVLYHSKGLYAEAVDALLHALLLDPRMQTAMRNLEIAATQAGACDAKLSMLADRVAADPDDRESAREEARLLRLIGRHVEAAHRFDALIAEDPDDALALLERGLLEQRTGDLRRAQRWFERASNADANNPIAKLQLAEVLYQRGLNEQSLTVLNALLERESDLADAHLLRGFVLGDMGHNEAGMEAAKRAAALNPTLATVQPNLSLERSIEAIGLTAGGNGSPVLRVIAGGDIARYGLGLAFRQRGYLAQARQEFVRALSAGEDERTVRHAIAELDLLAGEFTAASAHYLTLLATYGENPRWHNELGVARHQGGDIAGAADSYRNALRNDPRYALAYNNLGVALGGLGEGAAAREALERAQSIDPTNVRARLNLARWYAANGSALNALVPLRELATYHADNVDVWHEMSLVLMKLNRADEADQARVAAAQCDPGYSATSRGHSRLTIGIDLQSECQAAVGKVDLLAARGQDASALGVAGAGISCGQSAWEHDRVMRAPGNADQLDGELPGDVFGSVMALAPALRLVTPAALASESPASESPASEMPTSESFTSQAQPDAVEGTLQPFPTHPRTLCAEAEALALRGLHGEALGRYQQIRAETEWSGPPEVWRAAAIGEGRSLCLLGRGGEAVDLIERLLNETTDSTRDLPELFALQAAAHGAARGGDGGDARPARAAIAKFLRTESRSAALLHFVGDVAVSIDEEALAVVLFRRALAVDPMRPSPRVAIARLLRRHSDVLAARLELVAALAVAPTLREALLELAALHTDAERPFEALNLLVSHLHRDPTDVEALALLAETLVQVGRDTDARLALQRARRHNPEHQFPAGLEAKLLSRKAKVA